MNLSKAPVQGMMYALYTDRVVYRPYQREALSQEQLSEQLLELHLFDDTTEYRLICAERGELETVISDECVPYDDLYCEKIFTLEEKAEQPGTQSSQVEVVNYLTYDENDLLMIRNYRLKEVK